MKLAAIIAFLAFCTSCNFNHTKALDQLDESVEKPISESDPENSEIKDSQNEVMKQEDILFNGKLNRYFTLKEFETVFGKADSIKLMAIEEPCSYIFENEDGSKDMEDKYLYKDGSRFENTKEKVAVDEFRFTKSNFILYKGTKLNAQTSIEELQQLFPNAFKEVITMDDCGEGKFQEIRLREDENNVSDGHINLLMKNGKLHSIYWWFPC